MADNNKVLLQEIQHESMINGVKCRTQVKKNELSNSYFIHLGAQECRYALSEGQYQLRLTTEYIVK